MNSIDIQCEIITPLLMHGANPKYAELRPPSIKGVMRFWWRAIHGDLDLETLREREAEIFGNTKRKSSFNIKIDNHNLEIDNFNPLPHKSNTFKIQGFKPTATFTIKFLGQNLELIQDIFELATILGGFGQRARRGFGSIKIVSNNITDNITKEYIDELINKINQDFRYTTNNRHDFNQYPFIRKIDIGKNYKNNIEILKKIGEATHRYSRFGNANPKFASPLFVSVVKNNEGYKPIITTLNSTKPIPFRDIDKFIKGIIL